MSSSAKTFRIASRAGCDVSIQAGTPDHRARGQIANLLPWINGLLPSMNRAQRQIAEIVLKDPEQFISCAASHLARCVELVKGSIVLFCN